MNIQIITTPFTLHIHGFSGTAPDRDYVGTAFKLMDKMWQVVKGNALANKGKNIWVYEPGHAVFAGVELADGVNLGTLLEHKTIQLTKYAYYRHIGPYHLIKQAGQAIQAQIRQQGFEVALPHIEIYGDWTSDESKLETELLFNVK